MQATRGEASRSGGLEPGAIAPPPRGAVYHASHRDPASSLGDHERHSVIPAGPSVHPELVPALPQVPYKLDRDLILELRITHSSRGSRTIEPPGDCLGATQPSDAETSRPHRPRRP